jgi:hypothetical protein
LLDCGREDTGNFPKTQHTEDYTAQSGNCSLTQFLSLTDDH